MSGLSLSASRRLPLVVVLLGVIAVAPRGDVDQVHAASAKAPKPVCVVHSNPSMVPTNVAAGRGRVADVIRVSCQATFNSQRVTLHSAQLNNDCHHTLLWFSVTPLALGTGSTFRVLLDKNGNAWVVVWGGPSCGPGKLRITARLFVSPFTKVTTHFTVLARQTPPPGVTTSPSSFIEDATVSGVATVIQAKFPRSNAKGFAAIKSIDLYGMCAGNLTWIGSDGKVLDAGSDAVYAPIDHNGNVFVVAVGGPSCGAGTAAIVVDLTIAPHTEFTTNFTVLAPRPTI